MLIRIKKPWLLWVFGWRHSPQEGVTAAHSLWLLWLLWLRMKPQRLNNEERVTP